MSCCRHVLYVLWLETRKIVNTRAFTDNFSLYLAFISQYMALYDCINNEHPCYRYQRHYSDMNGMVFQITDNSVFNSFLRLTLK